MAPEKQTMTVGELVAALEDGDGDHNEDTPVRIKVRGEDGKITVMTVEDTDYDGDNEVFNITAS